MEFNGLGSLLEATEEQFMALYHHKKPQESEETFLEELHLKQDVAWNDADNLEHTGITPQALGEKLSRIIGKAKEAYELKIKQQPSNFLSLKREIIDVEEDGSFKVSGVDFRQQRIEKCQLCDLKISGPGNYEIENTKTHKKINFPELTMHLMSSHAYCGRTGMYRIEPLDCCRVLNLTK
jgi:hypothetical protein